MLSIFRKKHISKVVFSKPIPDNNNRELRQRLFVDTVCECNNSSTPWRVGDNFQSFLHNIFSIPVTT